MNDSMTEARLVGLGVAGFVTATVASSIAWVAVIMAAVGSFCGDSTSEAECSARQSGAEAGMIFAGLFFGALAFGAVFLVVRAISRPNRRKERWYLLGAALLLPMPTASVVLPLIATSRTTNWSLLVSAMVVIAAVWTLAWTFTMRRIMIRAFTLAPPSA